MIWIVKAEHKKDYQINATFSNEEKGIIDLSDFLLNDHRIIFQELKDMHKFKNFKVDMDTIVWANGADLAPEFLYKLLKMRVC